MESNIQQTVLFRPDDIERFKRYLYERENAEATICKYLTDIRTFQTYLNGDMAFDRQRVLAYKAWLCENYVTSSVNSMLVALNQFFIFLGIPQFRVRRLKVQKELFLAENRMMTKEEYYRLIKAAVRKGNIQLAAEMETMASTGTRVSELSFFTVEAVQTGSVVINNKGKRRRIVIPNSLRKKLLYYSAKQNIRCGRIFITRSGKPKNRSNLWKEMQNLKEEANVKPDKIFPHNLRHLFARTFYKMTRNLTGLADILGHSSVNVTRIYTAVPGNMYRKQIEALGLLLE